MSSPDYFVQHESGAVSEYALGNIHSEKEDQIEHIFATNSQLILVYEEGEGPTACTDVEIDGSAVLLAFGNNNNQMFPVGFLLDLTDLADLHEAIGTLLEGLVG